MLFFSGAFFFNFSKCQYQLLLLIWQWYFWKCVNPSGNQIFRCIFFFGKRNDFLLQNIHKVFTVHNKLKNGKYFYRDRMKNIYITFIIYTSEHFSILFRDVFVYPFHLSLIWLNVAYYRNLLFFFQRIFQFLLYSKLLLEENLSINLALEL